VHQVGFSLHDYIDMHGQQNIKFSVYCDRQYIGKHIYKAVFIRVCKEIQGY
jgi:hypothetical protein